MPYDLQIASFNFCLCAPILLSNNDLTRGIVFRLTYQDLCTFLQQGHKHLAVEIPNFGYGLTANFSSRKKVG